MKDMADLIKSKRGQILERWREAVFDTYPEETRRFLRGEADRFRNPIGFTVSEAITKTLDVLASGLSREALEPALTDVIKIYAVQDAPASSALAFLFVLKRVLRETLGADNAELDLVRGFLDLEEQIDDIILLAFDIYSRSRDKIREIKVKEARAEKDRIARAMGTMKSRR